MSELREKLRTSPREKIWVVSVGSQANHHDRNHPVRQNKPYNKMKKARVTHGEHAAVTLKHRKREARKNPATRGCEKSSAWVPLNLTLTDPATRGCEWSVLRVKKKTNKACKVVDATARI